MVAELVVRAHTPGPAWWRVSKGEAVVWVMGVPGGLPKSVKWDRTVLVRRLTGARRLILPPAYTFGLGDVFGALSLRGKLKAKAPIEATLPPELRARYIAAAALLGQPVSHYDSWKPAVSGLFMLGDFRKRAGLQDTQPTASIKSIALGKGIRATPVSSYRAIPMLRTLAGEITPTADLACLADALREIEAGQGLVLTAAQAWAKGDVPVALTAERGFEACVASFPQFSAQVRQDQVDEAAAIAHDLQAPGVSVAVVPLRSLVAENGVLAKLKAQGFEVRTPASD